MLLSGIAVIDQCRETAAIGRRYNKRYSGAHAPDSHARRAGGIPSRTLMSGRND
jgi:hypothetical protein